MQFAEARASGSTSGLRDPFAWREALTPPSGVSPASTARSSRSICSRGSNALTPTSNTPPSSPHALNDSARSVGSNTSSRSGGRASAVPVATLHHPYPTAEGARSWSSGSGAGRSSARSSSYVTPNSSARISEFGSVYESQSHCGSARNDLCSRGYSVAENEQYAEPAYDAAEANAPRLPIKKKQRAFAAAFDAFAAPAHGGAVSSPSGAGTEETEPAEVSVDPRHVFSSARHGRHKEVEASLAAGFDPAYADSYGNTLFHVACQNGVKRIAKLAIKYGGDMDAQNQKGNTGVHFLYAYGYQDVGEYFIEKGASNQVLNELGNPPRCGIR